MNDDNKKRPYKLVQESGLVLQEGAVSGPEGEEIMEDLWKFYDKEGNLKREENYKNGKVNGPCKWYYKNGQLEMENNYKDDKLDGVERHYSENGDLIKEIHYKEGIKIDK